MNEEIKEILDRLDFNEWEVDLYKVPITWCELYNIRDYITNLQQEKEDYKSKCEKAMKHIEESLDILKGDSDIPIATGNVRNIYLKPVLNKLNGSDKNE